MMQFLVLFTCLFAVALASNDTEWERFKTEFNRKYESPSEEVFRKKIFTDNRQTIERHNRMFDEGKVTFTLGINQFADLTSEEMNVRMNGHVHSITGSNADYPSKSEDGKLGFDMVDWRDSNCVTNVKDQGNCRADWAFSATGSIESIQCLETGRLVPLSEQNLMDCSWSEGNTGCQGGESENAFQYVIRNDGLETEKNYPYEGRDGSCKYSRVRKEATLRTYIKVPKASEHDLQKAVSKQPVSVLIDASHASFHLYKTGVYYEKKCSWNQLNRAVLVVGFGTESGLDYWIVKNSWGLQWGERGYIRMARNRYNNCGIATRAIYPIY